VVAEVVVAGQPDAPLDHRELAAQVPELQRLAGGNALHRAGRGPASVPIRLRIHHQSPVFGMAIIGVLAAVIQ
jgi:hypothetical protein